MHTLKLSARVAACWLAAGLAAQASSAYPAPPGGWTYVYHGDQLIVGAPGSGWSSLDGTWMHDNGSDEWDGSIIGGPFDPGGGFGKNSPGGAMLLEQDGVRFLRLQDTGDPRDYGYADPSNRKIYFGHDIGTDIGPDKAATLMDTGVTLTFRARIPTLAKAGPPLDPLHRDGQQAAGIQPYPEQGDGYVTSDGGKGNFVIRQGGNGADVPAGAIAFSFTQTTDTTGGNPNVGRAGFAGLTFNEFNGNQPTANVNFGQGSRTNLVAFDPTDWHELYIVILKDSANIGTHEGFIFLDGNLTPSVFKLTAGTGSDMPATFLAMGGSATPQNWALDVDFFGYKDEAVFPPGARLPPAIANVTPAFNTMFQPAAQGLRFDAAVRMPVNRLPASGFQLVLNGQNLGGQLALTGTDLSTSRSATYSGLQPNTLYAGSIIVTDSGGLASTNEVAFDTFVESQVVIIEAEDYNFNGGQFLDAPSPGAYAGQAGIPGVDFVDATPGTVGPYRDQDAVDTALTADTPRSKFVNAGVPDYQVGGITAGEWWNYTRTLAAGSYQVYVRAAATAAQDLRLDRVAGGAGAPHQTREFLGTFRIPRTGTLNAFQYVPLTDVQGRPLVLPLAGATTLRLTAPQAGGNLALNFLLLAPAAAATQPAVSVQPSPGAGGVAADAAIAAAIYDGAAPVAPASVKLLINGAEVPATVSKTGTLTAVAYLPPAFWAASTVYQARLTFNDGTDRAVDWAFTTASYPVLTPAMKVTDARTPGFVWRIFQNEAVQDATVQRAEDALAGRLRDAGGQPLPNLADANVWGPAAGSGTPAAPGSGTMTFRIPTVINVAQAEGSTFGSFTPDEQMPGIPGTSGSTDGIAVELRAFLELPRGVVTMIVNSDDGFRTTAGFLDDAPLLLGEFNGGRSSADSIFPVVVEEAGVYAFRTVYFEGGGNASLEWAVQRADGSRVLLNDTAGGGPRAYQDGTVPSRPPQNVILSIRAVSGGNVTLQWDAGTLQAADAVTGPYNNVGGATSPYTVPAGAAQKFYRVRVQ